MQQRPLFFSVSAVALAVIVSLGHLNARAVQQAAPPASQSGLDLAAIDKSADACTDFYQFACGGWNASHPLPGDQPRFGRFDELQERNNAILRDILEAAAKSPSADPATRKIGDYYAACMDGATINK